MNENNLGRHYVIDVVGVDLSKIDSVEFIKGLMIKACEEGGATLLNISHHSFKPQGMTMLALLAESHISYHSFPEKDGAVAIDIYTCGNIDPAIIVGFLIDGLKPRKATYRSMDRFVP